MNSADYKSLLAVAPTVGQEVSPHNADTGVSVVRCTWLYDRSSQWLAGVTAARRGGQGGRRGPLSQELRLACRHHDRLLWVWHWPEQFIHICLRLPSVRTTTSPATACWTFISAAYFRVSYFLRNRLSVAGWCVYILQLFFFVHQNYETTVFGNGLTDFHKTFTKR